MKQVPGPSMAAMSETAPRRWFELPWWIAMFAIALVSCGRQPQKSDTETRSARPAAGPVRPAPLVTRVDFDREAQEAEIHALRRRIVELEAEVVRLKGSAKRANVRSAVPTAPAALPEAAAPDSASPPPRGTPLEAIQRAELMTGSVKFSPGPVPPTGIAVDETTPLAVGQDLLLKWNDTWYASTILGFEPDGTVRVHYFGWDSSYDEIVPRSDLQLDRHARARAVDTSYPAAQ